jgi:hypothetical protein
MAKVEASLPAQKIEVKNTGIEFDVFETDGTKKGRLRVGKAKVTWLPVNAKTGIEVSWDELAAFFEG